MLSANWRDSEHPSKQAPQPTSQTTDRPLCQCDLCKQARWEESVILARAGKNYPVSHPCDPTASQPNGIERYLRERDAQAARESGQTFASGSQDAPWPPR
jgi:hypothetical protein